MTDQGQAAFDAAMAEMAKMQALPQPGECFGVPDDFRAEFDRLEAEFDAAAKAIKESAAQHGQIVRDAGQKMVALWTRIVEETRKVDLDAFNYMIARTPDGVPFIVVIGEVQKPAGGPR